MELALVENLQRQDLNPMEAARAYHRLLHEFGFTQETVAQRLGKDRSSIANYVRLINLPNEIQRLLESGALTMGHAKVILGLNQSEAQIKLAHQIVNSQLTVRQAEKLAAAILNPTSLERKKSPYVDIEEKLQKRLGTRVSIIPERKGGKIVLHYFASDELDRLVDMLLS
jgi:ParB family chromosome partitioning protein